MNSMNPAVLAIGGPIGSGKTTTATLLAQRLGWPQDGYGDTIRAIATARGLPASRSILQQLGVELTGAGWGTFTRLVLDHARWAPGQPLILDGPASTALTRARRRDQATGPGAVDVRHATELGLPTVRDRADLIIQARELEPAQVAGQVICYLAARLGRAPGGRCA